MADSHIDTRDLVDRLAELGPVELLEDDDEREEHAAIVALFEEITDYAGDRPEDGIFLIADDAFEDYARELADDIGAVPADAGWPMGYIDWPAAARALQMDYTAVEYDDTTYWYR